MSKIKLANMQQSIPDGIFYTYFANDQVRSSLTYHQGTPVGEQKFYNINGKVESVIYYEDGKPVKFEDYRNTIA